MKWLISILQLLVAAGLGALVMFVALEEKNEPAAQKLIRQAPAAAVAYFNPDREYSGARELVSEAINEAYGYNPKVACPRNVRLEKGLRFRCEALVRGRLVPVTLEVISPLGFLRVARIG